MDNNNEKFDKMRNRFGGFFKGFNKNAYESLIDGVTEQFNLEVFSEKDADCPLRLSDPEIYINISASDNPDVLANTANDLFNKVLQEEPDYQPTPESLQTFIDELYIALRTIYNAKISIDESNCIEVSFPEKNKSYKLMTFEG